LTAKGKERQSAILNYITTNGYASVTELADLLRVSESTIKRDLDVMDRENLVQRKHGGAFSGTGSVTPPYAYRAKAAKSEKFRIAKAACGLLEEGDALFIDAGSTTFAFYQQIAVPKVTVFTNSLSILTAPNPHVAHVYALEGEAYIKSMLLRGALCVENLDRIHPDKVFISSIGLSPDYWILDKHDVGCAFTRRLLQMPSRKIILLDSTKFTASGTFRSAPIELVDTMITNSEVSQTDADAIRSRGVELIIA
jgi:DeoR/GlpR family transcriptional regulator of sugar metabolism